MGWLHLVILVLGVGLMMFLNMKYKINAMLALLLGAILIGFLELIFYNTGTLEYAEGTAEVTPLSILESITHGFGSTLGGGRGDNLWNTPSSLAIIVVFGAVIGKLMVASGAATQIAETLIDKFGVKGVRIALTLTGAIFGLAVFYEVAFIILAPLIIAVAKEADIPFMKLAIPAVAATTTFHSLFPPQAGPVALVNEYGADTGMVYLYGIIVAIPTIYVTGWILPRFLGNLDFPLPSLMSNEEPVAKEDRPSFRSSILVPLTPAIIMITATAINAFIKPADFDQSVEPPMLYQFVNFIGSPVIAMFIAMFLAFYIFGIKQGRKTDWVMDEFEGAVKGIAMVVLIIGAGGALKQIILDTGIGTYIGTLMKVDQGASPLFIYFMAWLITVMIRLATGQGVVSAMTAAGIIGAAISSAGGMAAVGIDPAILVLATATGSNTLTHINDASFWLFKGYFDLSVKDTLRTWGLLQLCNSIVGLLVCLLLGGIIAYV